MRPNAEGRIRWPDGVARTSPVGSRDRQVSRERMETPIGLARRGVRIAAVLALVAAWSWALVGSAAAAGTPDVTIAKTSTGSASLQVGDALTYTITVTNAGTADAHAVRIQDDLPAGLRPTTALPPFPGGQCTVAGSVAPPAPEHWSVTCTRSSLAAGDSVGTPFAVRINDGGGWGGGTKTPPAGASEQPAGGPWGGEG